MGSFPPPATPTVEQAFETIAKTVLSVAAATITFSGIDTSNRMFRLTGYIVKDGTNGSVRVRLNNDSGTNYDTQRFYGTGVTVAAARSVTQTGVLLNGGGVPQANESATFAIAIAKQQTGDEAMVLTELVEQAAGPVIMEEFTGNIWNNTADLISRIDILSTAGNFDADTVALLEGNSTS